MSERSDLHKLQPWALSPLPEEPMVSILVASYNYEAYIKTAVERALKQSYKNLEVLVVDDGSTDASCSIVNALAAEDARLRLIQQENGGVAAALNRAYAESKGAVICLLDADDLFMEHKVSRVIEKLKEMPGAGYVQHAMEVIDDRGRFIRQLPTGRQFEEGWLAERLIRRGGRWRNMPASAISFRREIAELLFPLPAQHLRSMADAYLYMLAPLLTEVGHIPEALAGYRLHGSNLTGSLQFNATVSGRYVEGIQRVHRCIRETVESKGLGLPALDADRHLTFLEHRFMHGLFEGKKMSGLLAAYWDVSKKIKADDLYVFNRKLFGRIVLGVALFLPVSLRSMWVTWGMGGWKH